MIVADCKMHKLHKHSPRNIKRTILNLPPDFSTKMVERRMLFSFLSLFCIVSTLGFDLGDFVSGLDLFWPTMECDLIKVGDQQYTSKREDKTYVHFNLKKKIVFPG